MTPEMLLTAAQLLGDSSRGRLYKRSSFISTDGAMVMTEQRDLPEGAALFQRYPDGRESRHVIEGLSCADLDLCLA